MGFMNRKLYAALLVIAGCFLIVCTVVQPSRGDESLTYEPVIRASAEVFPRLNTTTVAYGIAPIWTWLTGLTGALGLEARIAGRCLSILGWFACAMLLAPRRNYLLTWFCLLHPALFVFATRCHPFWIGMAFLIAAFRFTSLPARCLCVAAATSLQPFFIPAAIVIGLGDTRQQRLQSHRFPMFFTSLAAGAGMISTWLLYGGQYPADFKKTGYYAPYLTFDGFTEVYFALIAATAGLLMWSLGRELPSFKKASVTFVLVALLSGLVSTSGDLPQGPLLSVLKHFANGSSIAWALAIGSGGIGLCLLGRSDWKSVCGLILAALALSRLPFAYERYAWFAVAPIFLVSRWGQSESSAQSTCIAAVVCLVAGLAFCSLGSL